MIVLKNTVIKVEQRTLFSIEDLRLEKGEIIALLGKNGTGKSTLLKGICRFNDSLSGHATIDEIELHKKSHKELLTKVAYVPVKQEVFGKIRLLDLVLSGKMATRNFMDIPKKEEIIEVEKLLQLFGLENLAEHLFFTLSDGEQKLSLLAKALFQDVDYILLDEPEAFLDMGNRIKMITELQKLAQKGKSIFFSTHQPDWIQKYCTKIAYIEKGKLIVIPASSYNEELMKRIFDVG